MSEWREGTNERIKCCTWSLTLREERRLRVCESWVLRGMFGPRRDEVSGGRGAA